MIQSAINLRTTMPNQGKQKIIKVIFLKKINNK